jgi:hypothetical protein
VQLLAASFTASRSFSASPAGPAAPASGGPPRGGRPGCGDTTASSDARTQIVRPGRSRLLVRSCRPPGARVRGSATNRATWVQGNVLPAISKQALKKLSKTVRSWRLHRCISKESADLARMVNPVVRGWMNYYGCFYRSALHPLFDRINTYLLRWIQKKYRAG